MAKGDKYMIPSDITVGTRIRSDLGDLTELAASILEKGIIQPITIDQRNELVAGGRRLAAFKLAMVEAPDNPHIKKGIRVIVYQSDGEVDLREVELMENLHRKEMTWLETLKAVKLVHDLRTEKSPKWAIADTARVISMDRGLVSKRLELMMAIEVIPTLGQLPNEDAARKAYKRKLEDALVERTMKKVKEAQRAEAKSLAQPEVLDGTTSDQSEEPGSEDSDVELAEEDAADDSFFITLAEASYHVGDVFEGLSKVRPSSYHFAEVDPPYAIELNEKKADTASIEHYNEISAAEYPGFLSALAKLVYRSLADDSFCVWWFAFDWSEHVKAALTEAGFKFDILPCIWYKEDSGGQSTAPDTNLARVYEPFYLARKGSPTIRARGRNNVFAFKTVPAARKIHPTQRPTELIQEILSTLVYPGARMVVPFLGSGASIIAGYESGVKMVSGWDLSPELKKRFMADVVLRWKKAGGK